jgi:hypothetical protein
MRRQSFRRHMLPTPGAQRMPIVSKDRAPAELPSGLPPHFRNSRLKTGGKGSLEQGSPSP